MKNNKNNSKRITKFGVKMAKNDVHRVLKTRVRQRKMKGVMNAPFILGRKR